MTEVVIVEPTSTDQNTSGFWGTNALCIITGASKGIGKAIAVGFAQSFVEIQSKRLEENGQAAAVDGSSPKLSFVLLARDQHALRGIDGLLRATGPFVGSIIIVPGSLDEAKTVHDFENVIAGVAGGNFDHVLLVHNAGSLGNPRQLTNEFTSEDFEQLANYFKLNVTSVIAMTGSFLRLFETTDKKTIVNISSLAGITPMKGLNVYGAGKAARDAFFRSVALENPDTRVLNYAPGPVRTDMAGVLRRNSYLQDFFQNDSNMLAPEKTVGRLISILEGDKFESGAHVDYFD